MKKMFACLLVCLFANSAYAGLILNVFEDTNNDVVFEFSGSDTVAQGTSNYFRNGFWFGDITDNIFAGTGGAYAAISDSFFAENATQGTTSSLFDLYLNGGSGHELGIRLDNWGILTNANDSDLIAWSGIATFALNFSDFMTGTWTGDRLIANGTDELFLLGDGYTITVGAAPVPEPSTILLLGGGLLGLGWYGRKRKKA